LVNGAPPKPSRTKNKKGNSLILQRLVLIGLAIYFGIQREWVFCIWSLLCIIPVYGLWLAIILAVVLLISSYKIAGIVLSLLIVFTLAGNEILKKFRRAEYEDTSDITVNFIRYCREYLIIMRCFCEEDAAIAVLDPQLGTIMDEIKGKWAMGVATSGEDPDFYLINFKFDSSKMKIINDALDEYSKTYKNRKKEILEYLRNIGRPMD
jgi:hypothetical protein